MLKFPRAERRNRTYVGHHGLGEQHQLCALRVIKPVLDGKADFVELKRDAEQRYVDRIQEDLSQTVWNSGCQSWYIESGPKVKTWNAMSYPYSQAHFWYRSLFPVWSD